MFNYLVQDKGREDDLTSLSWLHSVTIFPPAAQDDDDKEEEEMGTPGLHHTVLEPQHPGPAPVSDSLLTSSPSSSDHLALVPSPPPLVIEPCNERHGHQEDRMEMVDVDTEHEPSETGDTVEQEEMEHGGEDAQEAEDEEQEICLESLSEAAKEHILKKKIQIQSRTSVRSLCVHYTSLTKV